MRKNKRSWKKEKRKAERESKRKEKQSKGRSKTKKSTSTKKTNTLVIEKDPAECPICKIKWEDDCDIKLIVYGWNVNASNGYMNNALTMIYSILIYVQTVLTINHAN